MKKLVVILKNILLSLFSFFTTSGFVLISDPSILKIPIQENQEQLIDLKNQKEIVFGPSPEIPNNPDYTKMRKSVYDRLLRAQALLPKGYKFCLYEAYRSLALQEHLFSGKYDQVKKLHPAWAHEHIFQEATKLVAPLVNLDGSKNTPPHSTGWAIDVYLLDEAGIPIDMGIHPRDWMDDLDGHLSQTNSKKISLKAQYHRKIMGDALTEAGFVNYPTEYWHWSFGDRYWAYHSGCSLAIYGSI